MLAAFPLLLAVALAASGAAPPQRLAILPTIVEGSSGHTDVQRVFDELSRAVDGRVGIELVGYNELFVDGAEPTASTVLACGSDMACISRALRNARIELCLRAIVNFAVSPPLVSLSLIEGPGAKILAESVVEAEALIPVEPKLAADAADLLDTAKFVRGGRISVTLDPPDAKVTTRDCTTGQAYPADARSPTQFTVPPGCFEVEATRDTHEPTKSRADARAGETTQLSLSLRPLGGTESDSLFASPWFWVIAGGVALAAGSAVLIATDPFSGGTPAPACFCVTTPQNECDPCP